MITAEFVRQLFDYDPDTGTLSWKVSRGCVKAGTPITSQSKGYLQVMINKQNHKAHRVIWLLVHGQWPNEELDHRDGNRSNNRLNNLRPATSAQNKMNKACRDDSAAGLKGAFQDKRDGRWCSRITVGGKYIHLGRFATAEEAHAAYAAAAHKEFGEFACPTR